MGFEYIKNDEEENKNYNYNYTTPNEINFYLLKKNIKERRNKSINVNFISFKESLSIHYQLNEIVFLFV